MEYIKQFVHLNFPTPKLCDQFSIEYIFACTKSVNMGFIVFKLCFNTSKHDLTKCISIKSGCVCVR